MKRRYELNLYTPDQYHDLQEHLGHMASRGWMLERMEQHFLVYRQNVSSPVHYAVAFHPEVGDMDSLRTPQLEYIPHRKYSDGLVSRLDTQPSFLRRNLHEAKI